MPIDMFMKVDGVTGESKDANHVGWTDISSFSWGASQQGSSGDAAGKVSFTNLHITTLIDKSVTALLQFCSNGKRVKNIELSLCKAGGQQVEYAKITLEDVLVTSVDYSGATKNDTLGITYSFQGGRVRQQYWEQTSSGGRGAETSMGWDIKGNREM